MPRKKKVEPPLPKWVEYYNKFARSYNMVFDVIRVCLMILIGLPLVILGFLAAPYFMSGLGIFMYYTYKN
jgi:hypothetical protein